MQNTENSIQKICVIGDSHVSAFKLAWDSIQDQYPAVELTFFAIPNRKMSKLKIDGSKLYFDEHQLFGNVDAQVWPKEVNIDQFDKVLCVGMNHATYQIVRSQRKHRICGSKFKSPHTVSFEAFVDTWVGKYQTKSLANIMNKLGQAKARDVLVVMKPHPSHGVIQSQSRGKLALLYKRLFKDEAERDLVNSVFLAAMAKVMPDFATFVPQPEQTTVHNLLTKEEYSIGSVPLRGGDEVHDVEDHNHMNQKYGEVLLQEVFKHMEQSK